MLPIESARNAWAARLKGRLVLRFVDNEGCRHELVRGWAHNKHTMKHVTAILEQEKQFGSYTWWARVPSIGNVADPPSRLEEEALPQWLDEAATRVDPGDVGEHRWQYTFKEETALKKTDRKHFKK